jgi:hypothetical protein
MMLNVVLDKVAKTVAKLKKCQNFFFEAKFESTTTSNPSKHLKYLKINHICPPRFAQAFKK